jgi:hypothetical protein
MTTNKKLDQLKNRIEKDGYIEIKSGVYIWTKDGIIDEAGCWDDEDPSKNFDFSSYNFWITTDSGTEPDGFDDLSEAMDLYL